MRLPQQTCKIGFIGQPLQVAIIGRGGEGTPRTHFIYHHIMPGIDSKENPSSIFAPKNTLVENIYYKKETIVRDLPTSLIASKE